MKKILLIFLLCSIASTSACDVRGDTAKRGVEKYLPTPTPPFSPIPTPTPIDPAYNVAADTSVEGDTIHSNGSGQKKAETCKKLDRVMVNGDDNVLTVKGVCRQIMINGDRNKISADAAIEFVFNGTENTLEHSRFVNGKLPLITQSTSGNLVGHVPVAGDKQR